MDQRKNYGFMFVLLMIFALQMEMMAQVEARVCMSPSHGYHGPCWHDHNCALVCRNEGFSGGDCVGIQRKCYCTKLC
ncbi:defensin-like protein [Nicotiana attenuata]|uniref:Defensin-like protein n=1 Tax=Nicotiana attenuata TaxID=49451 RepID=A0A314KXD1_NICAT|nr:defensin-like protein [Nicotiana attenuata]